MAENMDILNSASQLPGYAVSNVGLGVTFDTINNAQKNVSGMAVFNLEENTGSAVKNAEYIGEPDPWNRFEAEQIKEIIEIIEAKAMRIHEEAVGVSPAVTTTEEKNALEKRIKKVVHSILARDKSLYVEAKRQLLQMGIETLSDIHVLDD